MGYIQHGRFVWGRGQSTEIAQTLHPFLYAPVCISIINITFTTWLITLITRSTGADAAALERLLEQCCIPKVGQRLVGM